MAANLEEQQCLRECTEYMQRSKIVPVMKDCFVQLCVDQPENPVTFLREYFQKLERVSVLHCTTNSAFYRGPGVDCRCSCGSGSIVHWDAVCTACTVCMMGYWLLWVLFLLRIWDTGYELVKKFVFDSRDIAVAVSGCDGK